MRKFAALAAALMIVGSLASVAHAQPMSYSFGGYRDRADPAVNNYLSAQYDRLLQVDMRFRSYRMWKECHIINWAALHGDCLASFDQYEPVLRTY
jgi:hypothetical protein